MELNWIIISAVVIGAIILLVFLIKRNLKDKEELEVFLNKNDHPIKKQEGEVNDSE